MISKPMTTLSASAGESNGETFFIQSRASREALAALERITAENIHLAVLAGARGIGKTRLIEAHAALTDKTAVTAVVRCPPIHSGEFQQRLLAAFGLPSAARDDERPLQALFGFLLDQRMQSRAVVLFVDDAQLLSGEAAPTLRVLTNLKLNGEHLLHIVLVGRPQLTRLIESDAWRAIRGEIGLEFKLDAMEPSDIAGFIEAMLSAREQHQELDITNPALSLLYRYSGGNPKALKRLFNLALKQVSASGAHQLTPEHIWDAMESSAWVNLAEQSGGPRRHAVAPLTDTRIAARIVVFRNGARLALHPLHKRSAVVGRAPSCEISADDASMSRTHARISLSNEAATLRDLASQNGSFINGTRINEQPILDGDVLRFGHVTALFYYRYVPDGHIGFDTQYTVADMAEDRRLESEVESLFVAQETAETRARVVPLRNPTDAAMPVAASVAVFTAADEPTAEREPRADEIGSVSSVDPIPALAHNDGVLVVSDPSPVGNSAPDELDGSDDVVEPVLDASDLTPSDAELLEFASDTDWFTESQIDLDNDGVIEIEIPDELIDADEVIAQAAETGSGQDERPPEPRVPLEEISEDRAETTNETFTEVPEAVLGDFAEISEASSAPVSAPPDSVQGQNNPTVNVAHHESGIAYSVDKPFFTIGRDADNDIQIDSSAVSRAHALIVFANGELTIEDLESATGTFLNNELVTKCPIKNGDILRIGDKLFRFQNARGDQNANDLGNLHEIGLQQAESGYDGVNHPDVGVEPLPSPTLTPESQHPPSDAEHESEHAEIVPKPLQTIPLANDAAASPAARATRTAAIWISAGIVLTAFYLVANHHGVFETAEDRRNVAPTVSVTQPEHSARPSVVPVPPPIQPPYGEAVTSAGAVPIVRDEAELNVDAPPADPVPTVATIVSDAPTSDASSTEAAEGIALLQSRPTAPDAIAPTPTTPATEATPSDHDSEIVNLLAQAQRQTDALKLTEPTHDNAFLTYQRVLKLDPANGAAQLGLERIAAAYLSLAQRQKTRRNYTRSLAMIERGLTVQQGHPALLNLSNQVRALAAADAISNAPKPVEHERIVTESEIEIEQPAFRETREPLIEAPDTSPGVTPAFPVPSTTRELITLSPHPEPALPSTASTANAPETVLLQPLVSTPNNTEAAPSPQRTQPQQIAKATEPEPKEQSQRQVIQMQIQRLVSQAKERFEAGDYLASRDLIEQGLGIEPRNLELLALRDQVIQRQARTEQRDAD